MSYIDAGYAIVLGVLVAYAAVLWHRRRRLERAAASYEETHPPGYASSAKEPGALRGGP